MLSSPANSMSRLMATVLQGWSHTGLACTRGVEEACLTVVVVLSSARVGSLGRVGSRLSVTLAAGTSACVFCARGTFCPAACSLSLSAACRIMDSTLATLRTAASAVLPALVAGSSALAILRLLPSYPLQLQGQHKVAAHGHWHENACKVTCLQKAI